MQSSMFKSSCIDKIVMTTNMSPIASLTSSRLSFARPSHNSPSSSDNLSACLCGSAVSSPLSIAQNLMRSVYTFMSIVYHPLPVVLSVLETTTLLYFIPAGVPSSHLWQATHKWSKSSTVVRLVNCLRPMMCAISIALDLLHISQAPPDRSLTCCLTLLDMLPS